MEVHDPVKVRHWAEVRHWTAEEARVASEEAKKALPGRQMKDIQTLIERAASEGETSIALRENLAPGNADLLRARGFHVQDGAFGVGPVRIDWSGKPCPMGTTRTAKAASRDTLPQSPDDSWRSRIAEALDMDPSDSWDRIRFAVIDHARLCRAVGQMHGPRGLDMDALKSAYRAAIGHLPPDKLTVAS